MMRRIRDSHPRSTVCQHYRLLAAKEPPLDIGKRGQRLGPPPECRATFMPSVRRENHFFHTTGVNGPFCSEPYLQTGGARTRSPRTHALKENGPRLVACPSFVSWPSAYDVPSALNQEVVFL